jgi:hypothetical protein
MSDEKVERLTNKGIVSALAALTGQFGKEEPDMKVLSESLTILVGGALIDLRTIANAVEKLSNFKLERVGDIVLGTTEHIEGLDLTPEEIETIEALRRGDIRTVSTSDPDARERRAIQLYRNHVARERERGVTLDLVPWAQMPENHKNLWRHEAELDPSNTVET